MEEDINNLSEIIELCEEEINNNDENVTAILDLTDLLSLRNLIKAYKEKDKDNNDLRRLYRRTATKLRENGKEELSDYFLAQINEVPTFTVDDDIDYYTEYYKFMNGEVFSAKQLKHIEENQKKYFIHKSLVEETIEELNKEEKQELKGLKGQDRYFVKQMYQYKISVLQELLEKRK